jgi:outer membrane biosynthesis protein TonB
VRTTRFGELDHHDLVHLLESLDDERAKARFRESIYISVFVWIAIAWFLIYGPRVLFHQGQLVTPIGNPREKNELTQLELPKNLVKIPRQAPPRTTPTPAPTPAPAPQAARPVPTPVPQPQRPAPQQAQQQPQAQPTQQARTQPPPPPTPTPTPQPRQSIPDAPHPLPSSPSPSRPSFSTPSTPGQSIAEAARNASRPGLGDTGDFGARSTGRGGPSAGAGAQLLSDPMGVDFDPYIKRILTMIRNNWIPLIPEECSPPISKAGTTLIRFRIEKDGTITANGMRLEDSTHDEAIDRAAWGGITSVGQFPPLPKAYPGQSIDLRVQFVITQNRR